MHMYHGGFDRLYELHRVFQRRIDLSYAAMSDLSRAAYK